MRNAPVKPNHPVNPNRGEIKLRRGFGQLAINKAKVTEQIWAEQHDPYHGLKGIDRHRRIIYDRNIKLAAS